MTDNPTPEEIAFRADMDRLRAAVGPAALEEAARRGVGEQMLTDALLRAIAANDPPLWRRDPSVVMWSEPAKPGWGWDTPTT
jgi:hypothetical protein